MVRGVVGTQREIKDTLRMLRLDRINHCVIVPKNPNFQGMLQKARFYITWGEINQETLEKLVAKRGRFAGDKRITDLNYAKELAGLILLGKTEKDTGIKRGRGGGASGTATAPRRSTGEAAPREGRDRPASSSTKRPSSRDGARPSSPGSSPWSRGIFGRKKKH